MVKLESRFNRPRKKRINSLPFIFALIIAFIGMIYMSKDKPTSNTPDVAGEMIGIYIIDVLQGDSILIQDENTNILIDSGDNINSNKIIKFLKDKRIKNIDHLIITHPHADHIGKMDEIITEFPVDKIYMPRIPQKHTPTTKVYEDMLNAIKDKNLKITAPKSKDKIITDTFTLEFLVPDYSGDNMNNYSLITTVTYGDNSFLFTGDIEKEIELALLDEFTDIDLLKVAHHGSKYATTNEFLNITKPEYSIISYGESNKYNHPHSEALDRLKKHKSEIFNTNDNGTVYISSDGEKIQILSERK